MAFLDALKNFASALQPVADMQGRYLDDQHMQKVFAANPDFAAKLYGAKNQIADNQTALARLSQGQSLPSDIQTALYLQKHPELRDLFFRSKRAQQVLDLGGTQQVLNPMGGVREVYSKTLEPGELPSVRGAQEAAKQAAELGYAQPIAEASSVGRSRGEQTASSEKRAAQAKGMIDLVEEAERLLPQATSGKLENIVTAGKGIIGKSDKTTQADAQLEVIAAGLLNNVPRMEGPQSDADRVAYERAAGDVANRNKSAGDRAAALKQIKSLQKKYANSSVGNNIVPDGLSADPGVFDGVTSNNPPNLPGAKGGWGPVRRVK